MNTPNRYAEDANRQSPGAGDRRPYVFDDLRESPPWEDRQGHDHDGRPPSQNSTRSNVYRQPPRIETKPSHRTTELYVYLGAVIAVLIASLVVGSNHGHADPFPAERAWFFIVLLTMGYLGSRGLAKAGANAPGENDHARELSLRGNNNTRY